jgi:hypothetical protein
MIELVRVVWYPSICVIYIVLSRKKCQNRKGVLEKYHFETHGAEYKGDKSSTMTQSKWFSSREQPSAVRGGGGSEGVRLERFCGYGPVSVCIKEGSL